MGTWGTALYSDDLATDLRSDLRDLIGEGLSSDAAVARLASEYASSLEDPDEAPVFWLAVAHAAWRLGRPSQAATAEALTIIKNGADLKRWGDDASTRRKREAVLARVKADLLAQAPSARRVQARIVATNTWAPGELVGFRLASGAWTVFRVIGHHVDKGGRSAVCEPLDWSGPTLPEPGEMISLPVRRPLSPWLPSQFLWVEPRRKRHAGRLVRTGVSSARAQSPSGYGVLMFPYIDRQLLEMFGLE